jgi:integrative and conjugative element protein (TIGR02256 family)
MILEVGQYQIELSLEAIATLKRHSPRNGNAESGGVILGQVSGNSIFIKTLTTPADQDKRGAFHFIRSVIPHNKQVQKAFKESLQKTIYLGEWHTHLESQPRPSAQDFRMIRKQFSKNSLNEPFILLMIAGFDYLSLSVLDQHGLNTLQRVNLF